MISIYRAGGKRALDVILAAVALVVLSPVLLIVALAIRVDMGRPVLFGQLRAGRGGRSFELLKFRTMRDARDASGQLLPDAARLTGLGRFLRHTSLDELPEFQNVLRGDMSLVGPRPLLMEYLHMYSPEQHRRHEVRPGITGWAQVNGRNALSWEQKFLLDIWYVDHYTFSRDVRILVVTVWKMITREGITPSGHVTMPPFRPSAKGETEG